MGPGIRNATPGRGGEGDARSGDGDGGGGNGEPIFSSLPGEVGNPPGVLCGVSWEFLGFFLSNGSGQVCFLTFQCHFGKFSGGWVG